MQLVQSAGNDVTILMAKCLIWDEGRTHRGSLCLCRQSDATAQPVTRDVTDGGKETAPSSV